MTDREKVIKVVKMCISPDLCSPNDCPYYIRPDKESGLCLERLMTDIIALLKEQEEEIKEKNARIWQLLCEKEQ